MPKLTIVPEGTKGRKPSVVWKPEEKGLLAEEVHRLRLSRPHSKLIDLLNEVQHILPQNHRRHIRGLSETPWFEPLLNEIAARKVEEVKPEPAITEPVQEYTAAPEPVSVSDITTGALIDEVVKRMGGIIRELLVSVLSSPEVKKLLHPPTTHQHVTGKNEVMQRHNPNPRSEDKVKLRRIVILGLNKTHQQEELRQEFNGAFDFRFVHSDANFHQLKTICAGADNTIVMTDKVSHKHSDCLKGVSLPFLPLAGNIGVLKDKLTDLYANS